MQAEWLTFLGKMFHFPGLHVVFEGWANVNLGKPEDHSFSKMCAVGGLVFGSVGNSLWSCLKLRLSFNRILWASANWIGKVKILGTAVVQAEWLTFVGEMFTPPDCM